MLLWRPFSCIAETKSDLSVLKNPGALEYNGIIQEDQ